jgi:hypothetical protein
MPKELSRVYMYSLPLPWDQEKFTLSVPINHWRVLSVQMQRGAPCVWAEVTPGTEYKAELWWVETGQTIAPHWYPLGTVVFSEEDVVYHLYVKHLRL